MKKIVIQTVLLFLILQQLVFAQSGGAQKVLTPIVKTDDAFGIKNITISGDGDTVAVSYNDASILVVDAGFSQPAKRLTGGGYIPDALALDKDGLVLVTGGKKLSLWDVVSGHFIADIDNPPMSINSVAVSDDGNFAVASHGRVVIKYSLPTGDKQFTIKRLPAEVYSIVIDQLHQRIYTGGKDGFVRYYNINTGEFIGEFRALGGAITQLQIKNRVIIAAGYDSDARLFDMDGLLLKELSSHTDTIRGAGLTSDAAFAVTGGDDGKVIVWDVNGGLKENFTVNGNKNLSIVAAGIDPFFRYIVMATNANQGNSGVLTIQYTGDKNESRQIFVFRDALLVLTKNGYVDGKGSFGKYINYSVDNKIVTFNEVESVVNKPDKLRYSMPIPQIAKIKAPIATVQENSSKEIKDKDTTPPLIVVKNRGVAPADATKSVYLEGMITDDTAVSFATFNGKQLTLDSDGNFAIKVDSSTDAIATIAAQDIYGNKTEKKVSLGGDKTAKTVANKGKNIALLIGINKYKYLPSLSTPEEDIKDLGYVLKNIYGFEIISLVGERATRDNILDTFNILQKRLTKDDKLIIYYAGHGYFEKGNENVFWQPYDANAESESRWILTDQILKGLDLIPSEQLLLVSDSCFAGGIKSVDNKTSKAGGGRVLITSGGNEPVKDSGTGKNSVFAEVFIESLKNYPPTKFNIRDMFLKTDISGKVKKKSDQTPAIQPLGGKTGGDSFILEKGKD